MWLKRSHLLISTLSCCYQAMLRSTLLRISRWRCRLRVKVLWHPLPSRLKHPKLKGMKMLTRLIHFDKKFRMLFPWSRNKTKDKKLCKLHNFYPCWASCKTCWPQDKMKTTLKVQDRTRTERASRLSAQSPTFLFKNTVSLSISSSQDSWEIMKTCSILTCYYDFIINRSGLSSQYIQD